MGTVFGSGYSQVPLAPESAALAALATRATIEIKAQRCEREDPIMKVRKSTHKRWRKNERNSGLTSKSNFPTCEAGIGTF